MHKQTFALIDQTWVHKSFGLVADRFYAFITAYDLSPVIFSINFLTNSCEVEFMLACSSICITEGWDVLEDGIISIFCVNIAAEARRLIIAYKTLWV